ncbi:MAG: CPBP family intramembrane metalloprotease [Anaerolineae bacterium]|nr:CPBP family intramembrane metalloprotease [Anaerolineae bacterium]MDW8171999.1 type II CAAX endopeptidase family protein [Anaerolineae bacterium]
MTAHTPSKQRPNFIQRHPIVAFFSMAYAFSWAIGSLLIANHHELLRVPQSLHYLSAFGPALAAVVVTALADGRAGLIGLGQRVVRANVSLRWWLIGVGTPLALGLATIVVYALRHNALPDLALFGQVDYLGNVGVLAALALWIATYGFGEEIGWRGFAFHHLESAGWLRAATLIGVLWGLWHLPFFFYKDNFIALGIGGFVGYLVSIMMGSILLSWLYRSSGDSILIAALWHGLFDFVSASPIAEGAGSAVISGVVILWVIVIVRRAARSQPLAQNT